MTPQRLSVASLALSLITALLAGYIALRPDPPDATADLGYISSQIDSLSFDVSNLASAVEALPTTTSEPLDLSPVQAQLDDLADRLGNLGFDDVDSRIDDVAGRIDDVCFVLSLMPPYEGC